MLGVYLGQILMGALIGGLIPLIIFFVKKRWGLGVTALISCGIVTLIHPIASIVVGIIFLIAAIKAEKHP